jgi:hypothetical protein
VRRKAVKRREKMFGVGRPPRLDRNAKVRIMHLARCLSRRTEPGKAYGAVTAKALAILEDAGILSWVQRIKRVRERCSDLLGANGWRWRVLRTSNAYSFNDPSPAERPDFRPNSSKSEKPTGTPNQDFFPPIKARLSHSVHAANALTAKDTDLTIKYRVRAAHV